MRFSDFCHEYDDFIHSLSLEKMKTESRSYHFLFDTFQNWNCSLKFIISIRLQYQKRFEILKHYTTEKGFSILMLAHWKNTGEMSRKNPLSKGRPARLPKKKDRVKRGKAIVSKILGVNKNDVDVLDCIRA